MICMTGKTKSFNGVVYTWRNGFGVKAEADALAQEVKDSGYFDAKVTEGTYDGYAGPAKEYNVWIRKSAPTAKVVVEKVEGFEKPVVEIVKTFKDSLPWEGTLDERKLKFIAAHELLMAHYDKKIKLILDFTVDDDEAKNCGMNRKSRRDFVKDCSGNIIAIALIGKLSVVTYLNAVAIATDNYGRFSNWGKDLFKLVFPEDYAQVYGASS